MRKRTTKVMKPESLTVPLKARSMVLRRGVRPDRDRLRDGDGAQLGDSRMAVTGAGFVSSSVAASPRSHQKRYCRPVPGTASGSSPFGLDPERPTLGMGLNPSSSHLLGYCACPVRVGHQAVPAGFVPVGTTCSGWPGPSGSVARRAGSAVSNAVFPWRWRWRSPEPADRHCVRERRTRRRRRHREEPVADDLLKISLWYQMTGGGVDDLVGRAVGFVVSPAAWPRLHR